MLKKCIASLLTVLMLVCVLTIPVSASIVIRTYAVGIALPVPGENPDMTAEYPNDESGQKITLVEWAEYDEGWEWQRDMTANDTFKKDHWYVVYVHMEAFNNTEYSSTVIGYINKKECKIAGGKPSANNTKVVLYEAYQCSDANKEQRTLVDQIDLTVVKPVVGKTPTFARIDTAQYVSENSHYPIPNQHNGVYWENEKSGNNLNSSNPFKADATYTVAYLLDTKEGYYFDIDDTKATINGMPAEIADTYTEGNGKTTEIWVSLSGIVPVEGTEEHTHTPSGWRITGAYHYKVCTACGDFLTQEDHQGGSATCREKGKCTVCHYAYLAENENHNPDTARWTACGNLYHAHLCKDCGAHCDVQDHVAGPAGTPGAAVVCRDCGYVITPAKDHKHHLTKVDKVDATCTEPGNVEHYTCDGCSEVFADSEGETQIPDTFVVPLGHKTSDDWRYDENNHWRICSVCNEVLAETQMAHEMENGKCTTCGYDGTESEHTPTGTTPDPTVSQQQDKGNGGMPLWGLLLIGVGAIGVGIGACVLAMKKKKEE